MALILDGDGTISGLDADGISSQPVFPGNVLQVASTTKTDTFSASVASRGLSGDVTGLTVTITPKAASSNLLVFAVVNTSALGVASSGFSIFRDGSAVLIGDARGSRIRSAVGRNSSGADTDIFNTFSSGVVPATAASSTTFSIRIGNFASSTTQTIYLNRSSTDSDSTVYGTTISSLTVMEIAA